MTRLLSLRMTPSLCLSQKPFALNAVTPMHITGHYRHAVVMRVQQNSIGVPAASIHGVIMVDKQPPYKVTHL